MSFQEPLHFGLLGSGLQATKFGSPLKLGPQAIGLRFCVHFPYKTIDLSGVRWFVIFLDGRVSGHKAIAFELSAPWHSYYGRMFSYILGLSSRFYFTHVHLGHIEEFYTFDILGLIACWYGAFCKDRGIYLRNFMIIGWVSDICS